MDHKAVKAYVDSVWDESIVPELCDYIRIPNTSPLFDADWEAHGYMDKAADLALTWVNKQDVPGMQAEVVRLPGRTPLLFIDVPGEIDDTVLLYGHLDKQPEFSGWRDDLDPWTPVIEDDKLYGRGGADDGYAVFGSLTAVQALRRQGLPHARCVVVIEFCEESGSFDLPHYIDLLTDRIGHPSLVVCLDAECGNYDQLWCTTTLRGNLVGTLSVNVLTEGVHSGGASGIVPSSFRIIRSLLSRVEDETTGAIKLSEFQPEVPQQRLEQAQATAGVLGDTVASKYPWAGGTGPVPTDVTEQILANTWHPTLSVTGATGLPDMANAGSTLRPFTSLKLSFRLPPTADPARCAEAVKKVLEADPPYGAEVHFEVESAMGGWNAPEVAPWLDASMREASQAFFGADAMYMGTGGSIPFMGMLGEKFPGVQFLVTGVLGPKSNAHGPNEFLHIPTGKAVTACVAQVLYDHARRDEARKAA